MPSSAPSPLRLPALCLASVFWAFSFGAGAPLASLWLQDAQYSDTIIGLNTAVYYLGIALAAGLVPWLMRRWGRRCLVFGMLASGLSVAVFPWGQSLCGWFLLRALNGVAGALSLIPLETLVNKHSAPARRARHFGFYAFAIALGMALGTLVGLQLYALAPRLAFIAGGSVSAVCGTMVLGWLPAVISAEDERHGRSPMQFGRNFLSFGSAWSQGFLEGGMVSLLPVYLLAIGLSEAGASWLMSGIMIGVILFQVPVAWLADRLGRTSVLLACYVVTAAGLGWLPFCGNSALLPVWLFFVGACSGAFYPLGLAILGERVPPSGLARANAWYLAINCLGSLTGPVVAGTAMDQLGRHSLFAVGEAAILLVLGSCALIRLYRLYSNRARPGTVISGDGMGRKAA